MTETTVTILAIMTKTTVMTLATMTETSVMALMTMTETTLMASTTTTEMVLTAVGDNFYAVPILHAMIPLMQIHFLTSLLQLPKKEAIT